MICWFLPQCQFIRLNESSSLEENRREKETETRKHGYVRIHTSVWLSSTTILFEIHVIVETICLKPDFSKKKNIFQIGGEKNF